MTIDAIRRALKEQHEADSPFQDFAVLIPLYEAHGAIHVLFEVRSKNLSSQPGEICLPGGRLEPDETLENTALRETCEELGICPDKVTLLGGGAPLITPFRYAIHPFVGFLSPFAYPEDVHMNPDEVSSVFSVPLDWLRTQEPLAYNVTTHFDFPQDFPYHMIQNGRQYAWKSAVYPILFYEYGDTIIWGMTAKIIHDFCQQINAKNELGHP